MESDSIKIFSYEELKSYVNNFSEDNLIGDVQFGKIYRGYYGAQEVTVKQWDEDFTSSEYFILTINKEILLLHHSNLSSHPNLVKLIGYCCEGEHQLCAIYDLKPLDSLTNLIQKDSFTWQRRIKVILGLASLLESMHAADAPRLPYLIRNISANHIILDEDFNPKLVNFALITGGIFPDCRLPKNYWLGCPGYIGCGSGPGLQSEEVDLFAFGVILKMIISKRRVHEKDEKLEPKYRYVGEWFEAKYKPKRCLAHKSLMSNPGFFARDARKITKLALDCTDFEVSTKDVLDRLLSLRVVKSHADFLGVDDILSRRIMKSTST